MQAAKSYTHFAAGYVFELLCFFAIVFNIQ